MRETAHKRQKSPESYPKRNEPAQLAHYNHFAESRETLLTDSSKDSGEVVNWCGFSMGSHGLMRSSIHHLGHCVVFSVFDIDVNVLKIEGL